MAKKRPDTSDKHRRPTPEQMDERHAIPLDPKEAIEALLKVDPESEPVDGDETERDEDEQ